MCNTVYDSTVPTTIFCLPRITCLSGLFIPVPTLLLSDNKKLQTLQH